VSYGDTYIRLTWLDGARDTDRKPPVTGADTSEPSASTCTSTTRFPNVSQWFR